MPLSPRLGAATLFKLAVPVVDREQRLVSIVTVDDVIDILQQETTEHIYALGGGVQSGGDNYFQMNLLEIARKRVVWLLVLLVTNTITGTIIKSQEDLFGKSGDTDGVHPLAD